MPMILHLCVMSDKSIIPVPESPAVDGAGIRRVGYTKESDKLRLRSSCSPAATCSSVLCANSLAI